MMIVKITLFSCFFVSMTLGYMVILAPGQGKYQEGEVLGSSAKARKERTLSEEVFEPCQTRITPGYQPKFGHIHNGSRVEIQQDAENSFTATFVECSAPSVPGELNGCFGVDHTHFASECVTIYEHRTAMVRLVNSFSTYFPADIRVPVFCECRLRRHLSKKTHPNLLRELADIL